MEKHAKGSGRHSLKTLILICIIPVILGMSGLSIIANYIMARDSAIKRAEDHIVQRRMDLHFIAQLPTLNMFIVDLRLGLNEEAAFFKKDTEKYVAEYLKSLSPVFAHTLRVIALDGEELLRIENGQVIPIEQNNRPQQHLPNLPPLDGKKIIPLPEHHFTADPDQRIQDWLPLINDINKQITGRIIYEYGVPIQELYSPVKDNLLINVFFAIGMVTLALLVTYWVLEINIRPLRHLTALVQDITAGDLNQPVAHKGSGELKILATSFEAMRRQLKRQFELLNDNAKQLSASLAENQRTQLQLKSERDYSAGIITDSPNLVCGIDAEGTITFINPAGKRITGYDTQDLLGHNFYDMLMEENAERFTEGVLNTFSVKQIYNHECDIITRSGERRTLLWSSVRHKDPANRLREVILIGHDISENKKVMDELVKFQTISDRSNYGCAIYDTQRCLTYINDAYAAMHGYRPDELIGQPQTVFFGQKYAKNQTRLNQRLLSNGFLNAEETTHVTKNGGTLPLLINSTLVNDPDGNPSFLSETAIDISEKKILEDQLQIRQRMDSLGTLAGGIAHDFNNLLTGISGYLQLFQLRSQNLSDKQRLYLKELMASVDRATDLIHQFQTLSRGSISKRQQVDLHLVADEVIKMLAKTTDRLIQKNNNIAMGEYFVHGNQTELSQVLLNLGVNANEAIEAKGASPKDTISVAAELVKIKPNENIGSRAGDYVHLTFSDTGCGMSESIKAQAFDPLFSSKKKGPRRGQGLGLAMVYNIVKNHNGHITIDSTPGIGTTFHIHLPSVTPSAPTKINDTEMHPGKETLLFVDDEAFIRDVVQELLESAGYTVITAADGVEALEIYQRDQSNIDLVITDLIMPRLSGEMLIENIMRLNPHENIIIISGQGNRRLSASVRAKAKAILPKPPDMAKMTAVIRRVMDVSQEDQQSYGNNHDLS